VLAMRSLSAQVGRIGDRLLERVAPSMTAEAVCGGWRFCACARYGPDGYYFRFYERRDPEHGGVCVPCEPHERCG
jgi:hypothetical protein